MSAKDDSSLFSDLTHLFLPRSIALVGASARPDSVGGRTLENLTRVSDFKGDLYLVNPSRDEIGGMRCYPSVESLPAAPDVVIITVPAQSAIEALESAAACGVPFAIILSSGFGEADEEGARAEAQLCEIVQRTGIRVYGPNCPGLNNINARLGMSFSPAFRHDLHPGPIGLATQGGGLGRTFMQAMERGIGVGMWASSGNQADLEVSDFIHYMADAPDIKVIVTLIEGFKSGRKFVAAVRHAARMGKPVVALKVGKSAYGIRSAQSHTASMTGSAEINSAVLRQFGVIEVDDIDELVDTAWLLARRLPAGDEKLVVYASSGGAATLAADKVGSAGLELAEFAPETLRRLRALLPSYMPVSNPVDVGTEIFTRPRLVDDSLQVVVEDPSVGLVLYPYPLDYGQVIQQNAESTIRVQAKTDVPILPVWMSDRIGEGYQAFVKAGLTPPRSLSNAVKAVQRWIAWGNWRRAFDPDFEPLLPEDAVAVQGDRPLRALSEAEGKRRLAASGIRVLPAGVATNAEEAVRLAEECGYPVVAKIASKDIAHKSETGGVRVGLGSAQDVSGAWTNIMASVREKAPRARIEGLLIEKMAPSGGAEVFVGVQRDPIFGHFLTFGLGGIYVEVFKDVSRRMLPLNEETALEMIRELRSFPILDGARGQPKRDIAALVHLLVQVSEFVKNNAAELDELDLNPVWVGEQGQGAIPLDAVILNGIRN